MTTISLDAVMAMIGTNPRERRGALDLMKRLGVTPVEESGGGRGKKILASFNAADVTPAILTKARSRTDIFRAVAYKNAPWLNSKQSLKSK